MKYKLAVVIPCWNCSKEIGPMLDGILAQSFEDWRLFCVDDLSTDNTFEVLHQYAEKDNRIVAVQRPREPKGAQTCRNYGFELAEGAEYVIWFDSDDLIAPWCFEQRVRFMDSNPDLDFAVFKAKSFRADIMESDNVLFFGFKYPACSDLRRFFLRALPFVVWSNIYRRDSLVNVGIKWDENILSLQDSDFNIHALLKGLRYDYADNSKIDYFWRQGYNPNSITQKIDTQGHMRSHIYFYNKINELLSRKQREDFSSELDDYLLFFVDKFKDNPQFVDEILSLKWHSGRKWFVLRAKMACGKNSKIKSLMFPLLHFYSRRFIKEYRIFESKQLRKALNDIGITNNNSLI